MTDFYRMDPGDWDFGTASLTLEQEAAYLRIINAIHKHKGPVPDNDRVLAGLFRVSTRKARALVADLIAAEKIVIEDGKIWNDRARSDLVQRGFVSISRAESGAKGGRTRAENAAKALKENNTPIAIASTREEKRREEIEEREPKGSQKKKRASRISDDWRLSRHMGEWSISEGMTEAQVRSEAAKFLDFWKAKAGRDAAKLDWDATWRNWCRKFIADQQSKPTGGKHDHRQFDAAIHGVALGLSEGTIRLRTDDRDPFAQRSGQDAGADYGGPRALLRP